MPGLSVKLPLVRDSDDGYALNKEYIDLVKQNFLNLLLTIPGERIMIPDFGIGLKSFLFQTDTPNLRSNISSRINIQVNKYFSFMQIEDIKFTSFDEDQTMHTDFLSIVITYNIIPLNYVDVVTITREENDITFF
jgi:uncharacterized protein